MITSDFSSIIAGRTCVIEQFFNLDDCRHEAVLNLVGILRRMQVVMVRFRAGNNLVSRWLCQRDLSLD